MSPATPIHHRQRNPSSSAPVPSTVKNPTSGNTSEIPETDKTDPIKDSNLTALDIQDFTTNEMGAQRAKAQRTTSSGTPTYIASSSDTDSTHLAELPDKIKLTTHGFGSDAIYTTNPDQPTLSKIPVPIQAPMDGLMYHLGPLSLLDADFRRNGETSGVSGGPQVYDQVGKAELLHISSWTSEDIVLNPNDSESTLRKTRYDTKLDGSFDL
ncbi:hypothetical protein G7Y89_g56 [Cudoniella acicularis]|uniref:Uncharacterized protein n=1 Tax=Cudoniella acicularis TaxID=354080 RepID=A0A8H4RXV9_9HELO|nr:hypothetical protein G7Y89_g56 [Cudoniella acicularis]